ncbi:MAG: prepilin-type N-terminal cleavage/methylation domain-containing protein [Verrucomicrobiales bacterium]|nr:prepilin-type N-terminal cleavage/methylation domain-containing protein [Verrucomicrobiales bacterium]
MLKQKNNLNPEKLQEPAVKAFSLIEVMIAIGMASIMFLALYYGVATGAVIVKVTREQLRATQVGLYRMEGIRLCNWTQVTNASIVPVSFNDYFYPPGVGGNSNGIVYKCTMSVSNAIFSPTNSYSGKMKVVTVTVNWTDVDFKQTNNRSQTFKTFVSKYGMQNYIFNH